ncbi:hypothetical protein KSP40_PGU001549 [Platanthera guangdongensis]|uniref:FAR1 domain-containing protein n=1 Tax=Platanthera guangdongensis TaxID=2320717 RepID=A0ABR2LT91_9ASPA
MYCQYAHCTGFSIRKQHITYWTHTRIIRSREYSCSKTGFRSVGPSPKKSATSMGTHTYFLRLRLRSTSRQNLALQLKVGDHRYMRGRAASTSGG